MARMKARTGAEGERNQALRDRANASVRVIETAPRHEAELRKALTDTI
jgi:hypothetical protein